MQLFYKTTLESKFIKYILSITPLPLVSYIQDNDIMIKDNYYLYRNHILKCTRTGLFRGGRADVYDYLTVSNLVYCNEDITVTDKPILYGGARLATYDLIQTYTFGENIKGLTETFISTKTYYDGETHRRLGDYLRLVYATQGINLMSLYNCFCNKFVEDVDISNGYLEEGNNPKYKVTLIPVRFNRTYTIAIDSDTPIYLKPVIYKDGLLKNVDKEYIYNGDSNKVLKMGCSKYKQPFTYRVLNYDKEPQSYENCLYLAIQLPKNNESLITVLEGIYDNYNYDKIFDNKMYRTSDYEVINKTLTSSVSLLQQVGKKQYTYSDKLITYLLQNTIDDREMIGENITRVQETLGIYPQFKGVWDIDLRGLLYKKYIELRKSHDELNYQDILGYVDVDIENALNKGFLS